MPPVRLEVRDYILDDLAFAPKGHINEEVGVEVVAKQFDHETRWGLVYLLVLRDLVDGSLWGFWCEEPATELQEGMDAWERNDYGDAGWLGFPVIETTTVIYKEA